MTKQEVDEVKEALTENACQHCLGNYKKDTLSCEICRCIKKCKLLQKLLTNNDTVIYNEATGMMQGETSHKT